MTQAFPLARQPSGANIRGSESGTVTLQDRDARWQIFNASSALTIVLPNTGTAGDVWELSNVGTGTITVQSSGLNTITSFTAGGVAISSLVTNPSTAANWITSTRALTGPSMTDTVATALGLKFYSANTSYNGGNATTITGTGSQGTVTLIASAANYFIPYQMQDGSWRVKFNLAMNGGSSATTWDFSINGLSFPTNLQACSVYPLGNGGPDGTGSGVVLRLNATNNQAWISGDVALVSKPTWAY